MFIDGASGDFPVPVTVTLDDLEYNTSLNNPDSLQYSTTQAYICGEVGLTYYRIILCNNEIIATS